jgi:antirestriction protein
MKKEPKIYVSTYHKYNNGNLDGEWLTISDYYCLSDFLAACAELHSDEEEPEYMYQDYEDFPSEWHSESSLSEEVFDKILEYAELSEEHQDAYEAYMENVGDSYDIRMLMRDRYVGKFANRYDFGRYIANINMDIPQHLETYIDYEKLAKYYLSIGYYWCDGYVFASY